MGLGIMFARSPPFTTMKIQEIVKIKKGNGGKTTYQYVDEVPDLANPIAKQVLTQPHLRQRVMKTKKTYNRKKQKEQGW